MCLSCLATAYISLWVDVADVFCEKNTTHTQKVLSQHVL
jgi:hypothetical protein